MELHQLASCQVWKSLGKAKLHHENINSFWAVTHITNALIKAREEKLKLEVSIPRKIEDGWDPMVKIKLNNFSCFALCDVGASASIMPKIMYDMLEDLLIHVLLVFALLILS